MRHPVSASRRARARGLLAAAALALAVPAPPSASAHHVGAYVPRDNEVSANFKQLKYSLQAQKLDVALRLYEQGAIRREMRARAADLPAGLEERVAGAFRDGRASEAERGLTIFFAALARDLALEGERQVSNAATPRAARLAAGRRLLDAIWRYYNLVDFAVSQIDPKTAVAVRLAYDDAESAARERGGSGEVPSRAPAGGEPADPARLVEPLRRIARTLSSFVEVSSTAARRPS
jgi:hypothetical protein